MLCSDALARLLAWKGEIVGEIAAWATATAAIASSELSVLAAASPTAVARALMDSTSFSMVSPSATALSASSLAARLACRPSS